MLRFLCCLLVAEMMVFVPSSAAITFSTVNPTVWTKSYIAMVTEIEPGNTEAGKLFVTSSKTSITDVWLNARKQVDAFGVDPGETYTSTLGKDSKMPPGSASILYAFSLISQESLGILFRDKWTFFQLREIYHLSMNYVVVTYHKQPTEWVSVICICGVFDYTTVTITFKDGINVTNVVEGILGEDLITITNQTVVFKKFKYRRVLRLESLKDLTGTQISTEKEISVLTGSVSYEEENRSAFLDHAIGTDDSGTEYIVWGLPTMTGNDICRVVAQFANTEILFNGNESFTLSSTGDFHDFNIFRNQFNLINATIPVTVTILLDDGGQSSSDMIFAMPIGWKNYSRYTFSIPSMDTDINLQHYVVVTTTLEGRDDLKLNGENLPADTEWIPVPGTDYTGAYIALDITSATQYIDNSNDVPFNAYLLGHGENITFGSALVPTPIPQVNTDDLVFSLERTFCERSSNNGNYDLRGIPMEVTNLTVIKSKIRKVSYRVKHLRTKHAQACQLSCFLYKNCHGVNFNNVSTNNDVNCDVIMPGKTCTVKDNDWTYYKFGDV